MRRRTGWIVAAVAAPLIAGCSAGVSRGPDPAARQTIDGGVVADRAPVPGTEGLSKSQLLDRSLSYDGSRGVLAGEVRSNGVAGSLPSAGQGSKNARPVVDYEFLVTAVHGAPTAPYALGSTVTIRVPAPSAIARDGALAFATGQRLLVWATDQPAGGLAGASSATVLPLPSSAYVAVVTGDTVRWEGYEEPLPAFLAHFREHPVR